jgi:hypothetical protein
MPVTFSSGAASQEHRPIREVKAIQGGVEMMRTNDSRYGFALPELVACLAVLVAFASQAGANCQERLASVDASLADPALDPHMATVLKPMRDQAAKQCASGNESGAVSSLQGLEMILSSSARASSQKAAQEAEKTATREQLTPDYLEGKWCSTHPNNGERGLWTFAGDGTYQVLLSEVNYGHGSRGDMKQFWQTFHAVISKEPDRFVVGGRKPGTTFTRGQGVCQPTGYRP